jgi:hypothetical protein
MYLHARVLHHKWKIDGLKTNFVPMVSKESRDVYKLVDPTLRIRDSMCWEWTETYGYCGKVQYWTNDRTLEFFTVILAQRVKILAPASYTAAAACVFCSCSQSSNLGKLIPNLSVNHFSHSADYTNSSTLLGSSNTHEYSFISFYI